MIHLERKKAMKSYVQGAAFLLLSGAFAIGCGGSQTVPEEGEGGVIEAGEAPEGETRRERREREAAENAEPPPRELTPEEQQALREDAAREMLATAEQKYVSGEASPSQLEREFRDVLEVLPNEARAWFNLGVVRYEQDKRDDAIEAWEKAGEVDPSFASGMANIGYLQLTDGDRSAARSTFEACIERLSSEPGCNVNLAMMMREDAVADGELTRDEAGPIIDRLRYALFGNARNPQAYSDLSRIYYDVGLFDLARLVASDAIEQGLEAADLYNRLGLVELEAGNVIVALQRFRRAVALDAEYADAWMNIGAMTLSFRDYTSAGEAFSKALELLPESTDAKLSYAVSLRGQERLDEAQALYEEILSDDPDNLAAIFNLGVLCQEGRQDYAEAVRYYELFQARNDDSSSDLAEDVANRIRVLVELMEILQGI